MDGMGGGWTVIVLALVPWMGLSVELGMRMRVTVGVIAGALCIKASLSRLVQTRWATVYGVFRILQYI